MGVRALRSVLEGAGGEARLASFPPHPGSARPSVEWQPWRWRPLIPRPRWLAPRPPWRWTSARPAGCRTCCGPTWAPRARWKCEELPRSSLRGWAGPSHHAPQRAGDRWGLRGERGPCGGRQRRRTGVGRAVGLGGGEDRSEAYSPASCRPQAGVGGRRHQADQRWQRAAAGNGELRVEGGGSVESCSWTSLWGAAGMGALGLPLCGVQHRACVRGGASSGWIGCSVESLFCTRCPLLRNLLKPSLTLPSTAPCRSLRYCRCLGPQGKKKRLCYTDELKKFTVKV